MSRSKAKNRVDGTWVLKWKKVRKEIEGKNSWVRIVKARLTARGFKDLQAFRDDVTTYSGTASKWAQRMVNQHAAQFEYEIFSMDISAAFLKGMTYEKISKITGDPLRSVQFDFPPKDAWLLQKLPGMSNFDYHTEVLDLVKALWGLKDAPRAFGLKLAETLRESGFTQGIIDPQVWRRFSKEHSGKPGHMRNPVSPSEPKQRSNHVGEEVLGKHVECMLTTHIDDIKGSGTGQARDILLKALRKDYGDDVKVETKEFEHVGIKHIQHSDCSIYAHQEHYVQEISEISLSKVDTSDLNASLIGDILILFWSLVGALAWLQQTRADICPFVGHLQRVAHKPTIGHAKRANKILRYVRRVKSGLRYRRLTPPLMMVTAADSAYQANTELTECLALRGYITLVVGQAAQGDQQGHFPGGPCTVLEWTSKKFTVITRSSFCAELRNQLEAAQSSILLASFLEENITKCSSALKLAEAQDNGHLSTPIHLCGDNKGVFSAVSAQNPKTTAEPTLTPHVKALREYLDQRAITTIVWVDNRDMIADPLTKGKTRRNEINDVLNKGMWKIIHTTEVWPKQKGLNTVTGIDQTSHA